MEKLTLESPIEKLLERVGFTSHLDVLKNKLGIETVGLLESLIKHYDKIDLPIAVKDRICLEYVTFKNF